MIEVSQREKLSQMLRSAHDGDIRFDWMNKLVTDAGYVRKRAEEPGQPILVTITALTAGFRVSETTVRRWLKSGMPTYQHSRGRRPALYSLFDVFRWRELQLETTDEADPLLRGGSSPALERYRRAKAAEAERKNRQAEELLIEVAVVTEQLKFIGTAFRTKLEAVARTHEHGKELRDIVAKMVDEAEAEWEKAFPESEDDSPGDEKVCKKGSKQASKGRG